MALMFVLMFVVTVYVLYKAAEHLDDEP